MFEIYKNFGTANLTNTERVKLGQMLHVPEAFILMLVLETRCQYQLVLMADWSQRIGCITTSKTQKD